MFDVPAPFDMYEKPIFVEVLVSDDKMSEYVFGTLVGGEEENFKVKVDTAILRTEGFNLENLRVRSDNIKEKDYIIVNSHKEDIQVDEERTDRR
jgi:hypothetical protein